MVGSAITRLLIKKGYSNLLLRTHSELDLINQRDVDEFFKKQKIDVVIISAAKVGGIFANETYRAEFIYNNLAIQNNLIHAAYKYDVPKLLFLGSSCIYPKDSKMPIKEEYLLTGLLEPTNEPYAIAKIAGIKMCENYSRQYGVDFLSVMPTNLYGPEDNFDLKNSHVIPALIRKFYEAKYHGRKQVVIWGTGKPRREFLYVEDLASACVFLLNEISAQQLLNSGVSHLNIGTGEDISISDLAHLIADYVGFNGEIVYDKSKPDGVAEKVMDVSRINTLGWKAQTKLSDGIELSCDWFRNNYNV